MEEREEKFDGFNNCHHHSASSIACIVSQTALAIVSSICKPLPHSRMAKAIQSRADRWIDIFGFSASNLTLANLASDCRCFNELFLPSFLSPFLYLNSINTLQRNHYITALDENNSVKLGSTCIAAVGCASC